MGKSGNNIAEHVRSAKMWLEKRSNPLTASLKSREN